MNSWSSRFGGFVSLAFIALGLVFLQVSIAADGLLFYLPAYGLIAIAAAVAFVTLRQGSRADSLCLAASALFAGYVAIRALTSPAPYFARADLYLMLAALVLYGITVSALSSSVRRIALIASLLIFAVVHVLVAVVQFGMGENFVVFSFLQNLDIAKRAAGFYENPDHLAGLLEVLGVLGLSLACWSRWPKWARVVIGYLAVVCYIGLALTGSRGGYLSAVASLIVFAVLSLITLRAAGRELFRKYGSIFLITFVAALAGAGFLMQQSEHIRERLANIVDPDHTRFALWQASIDQWKLQPLVGTGSGSYRFYGREFRGEHVQGDPTVVHNDYLHLLSEYGLIGAAAFLLLLVAHLRRGYQSFVRYGLERVAAGNELGSDRLAITIGALSAIGAYAVHSLVDFNMHVPANALLIAFVFGLLANPGLPAGATIPSTGLSLALRLATVTVALVLLFQCVRLVPGEYFAERARIALEGEDPEATISEATQALSYEQNNPNIYFYLGRALGALAGEKRHIAKRNSYYEAAIGAFEKASKLAPLDGFYALDIAFAYDSMGRFAEAEWMYGVARARDPRSVMMSQLYQSHLEAWRNERQTNVAVSP